MNNRTPNSSVNEAAAGGWCRQFAMFGHRHYVTPAQHNMNIHHPCRVSTPHMAHRNAYTRFPFGGCYCCRLRLLRTLQGINCDERALLFCIGCAYPRTLLLPPTVCRPGRRLAFLQDLCQHRPVPSPQLPHGWGDHTHRSTQRQREARGK
ncbi:unnamed protein product, partial [Ectocarpus sp. 13 AM-2016]